MFIINYDCKIFSCKGDQMTKEEFLENIKGKFQFYYDLKDQPDIVPFPIDFYAHFYQANEKYFGLKNFNIWRMTHDEHCFVKYYENVSKDDVNNMIESLKSGINYLVEPNEDHMKTFVTGVFFTENRPLESLEKYIEKFKYCKVYKFYLQGWCDIRLILIDLSSRKVYTNKAGKEVQKFYQHLVEDNNK